MNRFKEKIGITLFAVVSSIQAITAFATDGGMTGGGGKIIRDSENPWFLHNTKEVKYCVSIDPQHFHQTEDQTRKIVRMAIDYWKTEFADAGNEVIGGESVQVATQEFIEGPCDQETDLKFQMGYLTSQQKIEIDNYKDFTGLTYRTSYDRVNLRGKGFVYIAPDDAVTPGMGTFVQDPWRKGDGGLLYRVLIHELGHVFGIKHIGEDDSIMSEGYVDFLMRYGTHEFFSKLSGIPDFFKFRGKSLWTSGGSIGSSPIVGEFFAAPKDLQGLWMFSRGKNSIDLKSQALSTGHTLLHLGSIDIKETKVTSWISVVKVYLPPEQLVFKSALPLLQGQDFRGQYVSNYTASGEYTSQDGATKRQVLLQLRPEGAEPVISASWQGRLIPNILQDIEKRSVK